MSPSVTAKVEAWRRAGLFGPETIRQQIHAIETRLERTGWSWSPAASADLDELHELLVAEERAA